MVNDGWVVSHSWLMMVHHSQSEGMIDNNQLVDPIFDERIYQGSFGCMLQSVFPSPVVVENNYKVLIDFQTHLTMSFVQLYSS